MAHRCKGMVLGGASVAMAQEDTETHSQKLLLGGFQRPYQRYGGGGYYGSRGGGGFHGGRGYVPRGRGFGGPNRQPDPRGQLGAPRPNPNPQRGMGEVHGRQHQPAPG
jgi:hypothetical protein